MYKILVSNKHVGSGPMCGQRARAFVVGVALNALRYKKIQWSTVQYITEQGIGERMRTIIVYFGEGNENILLSQMCHLFI